MASVLLPPLSSGLLSPAPTSTPETYARIPFSLPPKQQENTLVPRIVGLLACQRDPLLVELKTKVVKCEKSVKGRNGGSGKGGKGKKGSDRQKEKDSATEDEWQVVLQDTVLFPEGGGQPSDTGTLVVIRGDKEIKIQVREVLRRGLEAIHYVDGEVAVGEEVLVKVERRRRGDHMTQHTGQHLLSAIFDRFSPPLPTLAWALSPYPNPSYIELPRAPTEQELRFVEERCNQEIAYARDIWVEFYKTGSTGVTNGSMTPNGVIEPPSPSVDAEVSHSDHPTKAAISFDGLNKLPTDYDTSSGVVRKVVINEVDPGNACCGTHWPNLKEVGKVFVYGEKDVGRVRGTNARVYFLCGDRIGEMLRREHNRVKDASLEFASGGDELVERAKNAVAASKESRRKEGKLRDELAGYVAKDVISSFQTIQLPSASSLSPSSSQSKGKGNKATSLPTSIRLGNYHREGDEATNDLEFLSLIGSIIGRTLASPGEQQSSFILTLSTSSSILSSPNAAIVVMSSPDCEALVNKIGDAIREKFGKRIKGGGKGRWQGKVVEGKWARADGEEGMRDLVRRAFGLDSELRA